MIKYQFTPTTIRQLLELLNNAALAHPSNPSSIDLPVAVIYADGVIGFEHEHNLIFSDAVLPVLSESCNPPADGQRPEVIGEKPKRRRRKGGGA